MRTVVIQSFREHDVPAWIETCVASVAAWADRRGYAWRFEGDALFARVPGWYLDKARDRPMVVSDLGRLLWARALLNEGWERVIWLDADVLVFDPPRLTVDDHAEAPYLFGREVWVQPGKKGLVARHKIHNALAVFRRGNPMLDFYVHACEAIVGRWAGTPAPQAVGPRLLGVLHNLLDFPATPAVGTFGPLVLRDALAGGGPALELVRRESKGPVAAANLGQSLVGEGYDGVCLDAAQMAEACAALVAHGPEWFA